MARLRDDHAAFTAKGAEVLAVGPDSPSAFRAYWLEHRMPFTGLPDPDHRVARLYRQDVNIFKLGRTPLVCIVGRCGRIHYAHQGSSMADIPTNRELLEIIDGINAAAC